MEDKSKNSALVFVTKAVCRGATIRLFAFWSSHLTECSSLVLDGMVTSESMRWYALVAWRFNEGIS